VKQLDFLFVVPGHAVPSIGPAGGLKVIYKLAEDLKREYAVGFLCLSDEEYAAHVPNMVVRTPLRRKLFREFMSHAGSAGPLAVSAYRKLAGMEIEREDLSGIKVMYSERDLRGYAVKRMIASRWDTAYYVKGAEAELKYYLVQHGEDAPSYSGPYSDLARATYSFAQLKKITINQEVYERFAGDHPLRMTVGINLNAFPLKRPIEERTGKNLLIVLRDNYNKGPDVALKAAEVIHAADPSVQIRSFGSYKGKVPPYLDHRGYVSQKELVDLYNWASAVLLTSRVEGFSVIGIEAMSCGAVFVTTDSGGVKEYVKSGVNGIITTSFDPEEIAQAVLSLKDAEYRVALAKNGLRTSRPYSYENMCRSFRKAIGEYEASIGFKR